MVTVAKNIRDIERMAEEKVETLGHEWTPSAVGTLALAGAVTVIVSEDMLSVDLDDGRTISVPIGWYPRLAHGTPVERANLTKLSPGDGEESVPGDPGPEMAGSAGNRSGSLFGSWKRPLRIPE